MELQSGHIYKSPYHGRHIKVMSIFDRGDSYTLAIYWIEPDEWFDEIDEITVSKDDVSKWKLVK
jgi:hypothetical protein